MALDATPGGVTADTYIDLADADAYFEGRFGAEDWEGLSDPDKEKALRQATRHLDRQSYRGVKASAVQALQFPRDIQDDSEIPAAVREATCEEALWIARHRETGGRSLRQRQIAEGVESFRVGQTAETFGRGSPVSLCPDALQILSRWIRRGARILSEREFPENRRWSPLER